MINIADLRRDYASEPLELTQVHPDPIHQFKAWFEEAMNSQLPEPNAMTLATADAQGRPTARTVLLKEFTPEGFIFFTNYESRKGQELAENPYACLLFNWLELARQVRIEGRVEKISAAESEAYFQSRPKGSQIGAWASPQSRVLSSRQLLEDKVAQLEAEYAAVEVLPVPPFWGGYRVVPERIEYWQGRPSRLHDRITYRLENGSWKIERLAP